MITPTLTLPHRGGGEKLSFRMHMSYEPVKELLMANSGDLILKKDTLDGKVWRSTLPGMWAWLLQRVSAILILLFLVLHFILPYRRPLQFLLLLVVALHASLGIRVFLIDLGTEVKTQKALFIVCLLLAALGLFFLWSYLPLGG